MKATIFFSANRDIVAHVGDVLSFDISVLSAPRLVEIRNSAGTAIDRTTVRIRIR